LRENPGLVTRASNIHYRVTLEPFISEVFFLLAAPERLAGNYRAVAEDTAGNVFDTDVEHPIARYEADSQLRLHTAVRTNAAPSYPPGLEDYLELRALDPRVKALAQQ